MSQNAKTEWRHREELIEVCRRMYSRGYIMSNDGNVSVRLDDNNILISPSGTNKGFMSAEEFVVMELGSGAVHGALKPSSESFMHVDAYKTRPDIGAVVHAHPAYCTALSVAGLKLNAKILPEAIVHLGEVPTVPYEHPGTQALADAVVAAIKGCDAVILDHHGIMAVGSDIFRAFDTLERIEHIARVQFLSEQLGGASQISDDKVSKLTEIFKSIVHGAEGK